MRKQHLLAGSITVIIITVLAASLSWREATFASREMKRRTGAVQVRVLDEFHSGNEWYAKAEITPKTGEQLLAKYEWKRGFDKKGALAGRITSDRLSNCSECFYRIEQDAHDLNYHPYNFTVYVLSPDKKVLQIDETFGS